VLYFGDMTGQNVVVSGNNTIGWNKTLVVEWWNIYITGDIRWSGILWLIALQKDGQWWNIYISPDVTDIHAAIYADRSVISYNGSELNGSTPDSTLSNQLYIYGSVFSEYTIGWSRSTTCPYYVSVCDDNISQKYDLNLLRRYILVQPVDSDGNPIGNKEPQFGWRESYMWDSNRGSKPEYRQYPLIIEYNPSLQQVPPALF